jgi:4-diphosphocytidyl-2C-methyl-D-erythritol kinase
MIIYDYKRRGRKTNSKSEPMKYKMVNNLKEVVNWLIENSFEPIEVNLYPKTFRKFSRIKVLLTVLGGVSFFMSTRSKYIPPRVQKGI